MMMVLFIGGPELRGGPGDEPDPFDGDADFVSDVPLPNDESGPDGDPALQRISEDQRFDGTDPGNAG